MGKIAQAQARMQGKKFQTRDLVKQESQETRQRAQAQSNDAYAKATARREQIRGAFSALHQRRAQNVADSQASAQKRLEERAAQENLIKKEKEDAILAMEREEVELLARL